ncbi:GNAT family N-acetyltransferase [Opitutus sp. ER46]|uniref:GNAT family N-acetyltransferase n=1 Tax=Opitutus sp. ER46 TaxID=2161864 RepID=UPI001304C748|nr:GNAT family N-acetyltransferase [Opitutus sp. ER46]
MPRPETGGTGKFTVRPFEMRDLDPVADLLVEVFWDNPVYRQIFGPKDTMRGLRWVFRREVLLNLRYGEVKVICLPGETGQVIGTFSLTPPDAAAPSVFDYVRLGILGMPFRFGPAALVRMLSLMKQNERTIATAMQGVRCWYLGLVAVSPRHRNQRIASGSLAQAFAALGPSSEVVLSTQLESNVRLYTRLGFQVVAEPPLGWRHDKVRNWVMYRNATSAPGVAPA